MCQNTSILLALSSFASMAEASRDLAQGTIEAGANLSFVQLQFQIQIELFSCCCCCSSQVMVSEVVCAKERMEAREV